MGFIAGCFSPKKEWREEAVKSALINFDILPGESSEDYEHIVLKSPCGFVMAKQKGGSPAGATITENESYIELLLGYQLPGDFSGCNPIERCQRAEGGFASIIVDKKGESVHIFNDRFAMRPFYVYAHDGEVIFSSNLMFVLSMLEGRGELDPVGVMEMFIFKGTQYEETHIKHMKRLVPGSHYVIDRDGVRWDNYWTLEFDPVSEDEDPDEYAGLMFNAFRDGLEKRIAYYPHGVMALSGGLDSRLLAGVMPEECGYSAFTFIDSVEGDNTPEVDAAKQVAKALSMKHIVREVKSNSVSSQADVVTRLVGGGIPLHHACKTMEFIAELLRVDRCLAGGGAANGQVGEHIRSTLYLDEKSTDRYLDYYVKGYIGGARSVIKRLFKADLYEAHFDQIYNTFQNRLRSQSGSTLGYKITAYNSIYRRTGSSFPSPIHTHPDITEFCPHLDYTYCDVLLKLPGSWLYRKNLYQYMIYTYFPQLREIPYANTGEPLDGVLGRYRPSLKKKVKYWLDNTVLSGVAARQKKRQLRMHNPKTFTYEMVSGDQAMLDVIEQGICESKVMDALFNKEACLSFVKDFREGRCITGRYINDTEIIGLFASLCYLVKSDVMSR